MTTYTAYLTVEIAEWLIQHGDLRANHAKATHTGHGIVTFGDDVMPRLEGLTEDDDGCISRHDLWGLRIWVQGYPYPVITDEGDEADVLAQTIKTLPEMPRLARVVTARRLVNVAKGVLSAIADATVSYMAAEHRGAGGYRTVADLLGVTESTVNKAISDHNRRVADRPRP